MPTGRADFAVFFGELQGVDHTQHFVNIPTQRQIVNDLMTHHAFLVDQERTAESNTGFRVFDIIGLTDSVGDIRNQGVFNRANAAFINGRVAPGIVGELGIDGYTDNLDATLAEFFQTVIEGDQLRRANKRKIKRIKENDGIFAFAFLFEIIVFNNLAIAEYGGSGKIRGFTTD